MSSVLPVYVRFVDETEVKGQILSDGYWPETDSQQTVVNVCFVLGPDLPPCRRGWTALGAAPHGDRPTPGSAPDRGHWAEIAK